MFFVDLPVFHVKRISRFVFLHLIIKIDVKLRYGPLHLSKVARPHVWKQAHKGLIK